jgi:signal peptidase
MHANLPSNGAPALGCELTVDVVRTFGEARLKVNGASMLPSVWPGDVVTVQRRELAELQPGQIVLCYREGELIAHRVRSVLGDCLIVQGDSLPQSDPPMAASDIVGQVVSIVRNGRSIPLEQTWWQASLGSLLRRSDFCTRMTLRFGRRWQRLRSLELIWAS